MKKLLSVLAILAVLMTSVIPAYAAQPTDETASTYASGYVRFNFTVVSDGSYFTTSTQKMEVGTPPRVMLLTDISSMSVRFDVCYQEDPFYKDPANDAVITNYVTMSSADYFEFTYKSGWGTSTDPEDLYYMRVYAASNTSNTAVISRSGQAQWDI